MCDNWQQTQQMFSSLFEKPKMSEKLLCKPPFKYIFDIIMETTNATSFAKGLYPDDESNSAYYQNKDQKIMFLKKLIEITSLMLKQEFDAKPQKIVAGLEPQLTNTLLQGVYTAAMQKEDPAPYVLKVLQMNGQASAEQPAQQEKPKKKPEQEEKPKKQKPQEKPAEEAPQKQKKQRPPPPPDDDEEETLKPTKQSSKPKNVKVVDERKQRPAPKGVIKDGKGDDLDDEDLQMQQEQTFKKVDAKAHHGKFIQDAMKDEDDLVQEKQEPASNEPSGGGIKMKKKLGQKKQTTTDTQVQGEQTSGQPKATSGGQSAGNIDDIEGLTKLVQTICQNANPLGKSLEFINDDIESMNNELQYWNKQYQASKEKMQKEMRTTDETLQPLQDKITEIDLQIFDEKAKIQNMKSQIIKNQYTIKTLLHSVVVSK